MRAYDVALEGITPLLMHRDNLEFKAIVEKWQRDPANRDLSVPGDDRSPAWGWIGSLYEDGKRVAIPTDAIMASLGGAGCEVRAPRGKRSLKAETQSGMAFMEPFLSFTTNGGSAIAMTAVKSLLTETAFEEHLTRARGIGFALDVRRAKIGTSKHVRVRPVFEKWRATGTLSVWNDVLTSDVLQTIFFTAGEKYGILEWRPDPRTKRPGPFGRFRAQLTERR